MQTNFLTCLQFTLQAEGKFSDNPLDPGGATMEGITLATYRSWKNDQSLTADDLKNITSAEVSAIYSQNYWATNSCDSLASGVDLMIFDMDVNAGDSRSAKLLQAACGVTVDGAIGPATLAVANNLDPTKLINGLATNQAAYYKSLSTFPTFGRGWLNRVNARQAAALAMVSTTPVPLPTQPLPVQPLTPADNPPDNFWTWLSSVV